MKPILLIIFCTACLRAGAQSLPDLQRALVTSGSAIQAIHHYPQDIKDGECHNVPVTGIVIQGNTVTITETWTNYMNGKSKTVLKGTLHDQVADGTWESSYSAGNWSYNFTTGIGRWNKTKAPLRFGTFRNYQQLTFRVVKRAEVHDGFRPCK